MQHELGFPVFTHLIASLFFLAVGIFYFLRNTAARYFDIPVGGFERDQRREFIVEEDFSVCGKLSTKKCSRCKSVRYCSADCQKSDWDSGHQRKCKDVEITNLTPSGDNALRFRDYPFSNRYASKIALVLGRGPKKSSLKPREVLFPYDEFVNYFNLDNPDLTPCGLMNCGNSCFANVILQCLSWTRPLVAHLLEKGHKRECRRNIGASSVNFKGMLRERLKVGSLLMNIISRLTNIGGTLGYGRQEDAHEFMRYAIDTMQSVCLDEFGGEKVVPPCSQETTFIQYVFGGLLQTQVQCTVCNNVSDQYENMMDLTVEIHGDAVSLEECLDQFTATEWLQGDNMYKCDRCSDYVKACKRLTIQRAPNILTIALKRLLHSLCLLLKFFWNWVFIKHL